jgi:protein SCO1
MEDNMELREKKGVPPFGMGMMWMLQRNSWVLLLIFLACGSKKTAVPYYHTPDFTPIWASETPVDLDTLHTIAQFEFTNQEGNKVSNDLLNGKIYVAGFFFTRCPSICPKLTGNLDKVADAFQAESNLNFLMHSVTPAMDSVSRLKQYWTDYELDSRWHLLTGDEEAIYTLARRSYFVEQRIGFDLSTNEFLHTENFLLVDGDGHLRGLYKGTLETEMDRLIEDIKILLAE